jgi:hypothetical protein
MNRKSTGIEITHLSNLIEFENKGSERSCCLDCKIGKLYER